MPGYLIIISMLGKEGPEQAPQACCVRTPLCRFVTESVVDCEAGVSAFSKGGNEGALYAALLVNGVQWIATVITVICVDKACFHSFLLCVLEMSCPLP